MLHCDYVRQFFKPRITDKHICDCDSCRINFNNLFWSPDQRFDNISNCSSPNNPSDNEEYTPSFDNKTGILSYSHFNFSTASKCLDNALPIDVTIRNHPSSDDGSESSMKTSRINNRMIFECHCMNVIWGCRNISQFRFVSHQYSLGRV